VVVEAIKMTILEGAELCIVRSEMRIDELKREAKELGITDAEFASVFYKHDQAGVSSLIEKVRRERSEEICFQHLGLSATCMPCLCLINGHCHGGHCSTCPRHGNCLGIKEMENDHIKEIYRCNHFRSEWNGSQQQWLSLLPGFKNGSYLICKHLIFDSGHYFCTATWDHTTNHSCENPFLVIIIEKDVLANENRMWNGVRCPTNPYWFKWPNEDRNRYPSYGWLSGWLSSRIREIQTSLERRCPIKGEEPQNQRPREQGVKVSSVPELSRIDALKKELGEDG
jgi:hypothetical protein